MKRIAIITYSRAYNYGSALQSYALNNYLTGLRTVVNTIDYTTSSQQRLYSIFEPIKGIPSIARNLYSLYYFFDIKRHKNRFDSFIKYHIPMTLPIKSPVEFEKLNGEYDLFVCGSDQIWNTNCDDFDSNYMLSFVKEKSRCVAYAPSLGAGATAPKTRELLSKYVCEFKAISSREFSSIQIISNATGRYVENVVDPVFLLDKNEWSKIIDVDSVPDSYVLGYFIGDVKGMRDFASTLSKASKMPVITIYESIRDMKYGFHTRYDAGPLEFVSLVKRARFVVTNSFHAVSFSLIFEVPFWAFDNTSFSDSRLWNILDIVGLTDRIINEHEAQQIDCMRDIDYSKMDRGALEDMIILSKTFLKNCVEDGTL